MTVSRQRQGSQIRPGTVELRVTEAVGRICPGKGKPHPSPDLCNRAHHRGRQKVGHYRERAMQDPSKMGRLGAMTDTVATGNDFARDKFVDLLPNR